MKSKLLILICAAFLFSCKKDSKTCNKDMAGIAGSYRITAIGYKASAGAAETDVLATYLDACERDDISVLNANGTLTYTDAGTKCSPAGDYSSTWSVTGSTIVIDSDSYTIQSFDCTTLVVTSSNVLAAGDQLKVTLVRQ